MQTYEETPQFENGVGMVREFITAFNRGRARLKGIRSDRRVMFLTGVSACPFMLKEVMPYIQGVLGLDVQLYDVPNRFWGKVVTVSGLLTGQDLLDSARPRADQYDAVVLPPNCLNAEQLFLDNLTLEQFRSVLGKKVYVGSYNLAETIREVYS